MQKTGMERDPGLLRSVEREARRLSNLPGARRQWDDVPGVGEKRASVVGLLLAVLFCLFGIYMCYIQVRAAIEPEESPRRMTLERYQG